MVKFAVILVLCVAVIWLTRRARQSQRQARELRARYLSRWRQRHQGG
ncbi:MAG: hypothetical protein ACUVTG_12955 [Candidatus Oleimicrobiaceae bacterium]